MFSQPKPPHFAAVWDVTMWVNCSVKAGEVQNARKQNTRLRGVLTMFLTPESIYVLQNRSGNLLCHLLTIWTQKDMKTWALLWRIFPQSFFIQFLHTIMLLKMVCICQLLTSLCGCAMNHWVNIINMHFDENNSFKRNCQFYSAETVSLLSFVLASAVWSQSMAVILAKNHDY